MTKKYDYSHKEGVYTTLLMSTGLTFGRTHGIIDQQQYSLLIVAIIGSAVVPTLIANAFFIPKYLLPKRDEPWNPPAVTAAPPKQSE